MSDFELDRSGFGAIRRSPFGAVVGAPFFSLTAPTLNATCAAWAKFADLQRTARTDEHDFDAPEQTSCESFTPVIRDPTAHAVFTAILQPSDSARRKRLKK